MPNFKLKNPLLRRFWFRTNNYLGFGVTAYSLEDAKELLEKTFQGMKVNFEITGVIEDVDIQTLDPKNVLPNIGASNFRGVWYPNLNLRMQT